MKSMINSLFRLFNIYKGSHKGKPNLPTVSLTGSIKKYFRDKLLKFQEAEFNTSEDMNIGGNTFAEKKQSEFEHKTVLTEYSITKNHDINNVDVSVIISLYNYQDYIMKAVESVLMDEDKPLTEIVIVNDSSTDDSLSVVQSLLQSDQPITIINKFENTGLVDTRNLGILHCKGDYVFILDADNTINPGCLREHYRFLESNPDHIACYAIIECVDENNSFVRHASHMEFDFEELKKVNYIDAMAMFNKQELIDIGLYDTELIKVGIGWEDYELWLRIGNLNKKVGFIQSHLSNYLVKNGSMLFLTHEESNKKKLVEYLNTKYGADIQ